MRLPTSCSHDHSYTIMWGRRAEKTSGFSNWNGYLYALFKEPLPTVSEVSGSIDALQWSLLGTRSGQDTISWFLNPRLWISICLFALCPVGHSHVMDPVCHHFHESWGFSLGQNSEYDWQQADTGRSKDSTQVGSRIDHLVVQKWIVHTINLSMSLNLPLSPICPISSLIWQQFSTQTWGS